MKSQVSQVKIVFQVKIVGQVKKQALLINKKQSKIFKMNI